MWFPSPRFVEEVHDAIIARGGGERGILHRGSLEAAIERARWGPFHTGDLAERAALLVRGVIRDHPFVDGNKRTAYETADILLRFNGYRLVVDREEVVEMMVEIAKGDVDLARITRWLRKNMRKR